MLIANELIAKQEMEVDLVGTNHQQKKVNSK